MERKWDELSINRLPGSAPSDQQMCCCQLDRGALHLATLKFNFKRWCFSHSCMTSCTCQNSPYHTPSKGLRGPILSGIWLPCYQPHHTSMANLSVGGFVVLTVAPLILSLMLLRLWSSNYLTPVTSLGLFKIKWFEDCSLNHFSYRSVVKLVFHI